MDKGGGCKPAHIEWKVASKSAGAIKVYGFTGSAEICRCEYGQKSCTHIGNFQRAKLAKKIAECVIFKITYNWLKKKYYDILLLSSFSIKIKKKSFWGYYKGIANK